MSKASIRWRDYSGEYSSTAFNVATPSGATYDWDALAASIDAVGDAMEAVTFCTRGKEQVSVATAIGSDAYPVDEEAQRELALRIFYQDDVTGKKYHVSLPGPQLPLMVSLGFDVVSWSGAEMVALESAFEANVLSPDGNAVSIVTGTIVGRRN